MPYNFTKGRKGDRLLAMQDFAGRPAADFEMQAALANSPDADGCAVIMKWHAPALLPSPRGAILARYLLTIS